MVKIQPFGERVVVRVHDVEEKVVGGIVLAAAPKASSNKGTVVAVGEGTTLSDGTVKPLSVKEGDLVLFTPGSGMSYSTDKEDYKVLNIREILGKLVEGEE